jgi:galactokinase
VTVDTHIAVDAEQLSAEFAQEFGGTPQIYRAPGRVNLIGEHTDYNDGFVLPAAIHFSTSVAISSRRDGRVMVVSKNMGERAEFGLEHHGPPSAHWTNFVRGVITLLSRNFSGATGANLLISSDVPLGAGLSSSAALEVATAAAYLGISNRTMELRDLALLCQRAEHEFVGTRCGIMDQFIACVGEAGKAILLDCRSLEYRPVEVPADLAIVICNTMVKHSLAAGEYNARRSECEEAVGILRRRFPNIRSLRDTSMPQLEELRESMPKVIFRRARHVVGEITRTQEFVAALEANETSRAGELMYQSHESLRDDYEVSCPELDTLVEIARELPDVVGARMTGGGFGGCTVNLVRQDASREVSDRLQSEYKRITGILPEVYVTQPARGVSRIA